MTLNLNKRKITLYRFKLTCALLILSLYGASAMANNANHLKVSKHIANELITALTSQDYQEIKRFTDRNISQQNRDNLGLDRYSNYLAAESHFHGGLDFHSIVVVDNGPSSIDSNVLVKSKNTELWYSLSLSLTEQAPHKISRIRLNTTDAPSGLAAPSSFDDAGAAQKLGHYIDKLSAAGTFSGAVLVAKGDQVLVAKATGLASKRFGVANNIDTRFNLGSMNKMFTSVAILRLVQDGKLKLDDYLATVLAVEGLDKRFSQIQIQHLLSHSSGIGRLSCEQGEVSVVKSIADCEQALSQVELNFTPGTNYRYSNDGMLILGLVIERISGQLYDQYIKKNIYDVAGMSDTASLDLQFPVSNAAIGYSYYGKAQSWRNNLFIHDKKGGPAGGGYSTVKDLYQFSRALLDYKLLNKQLTTQALTIKKQFNSTRYGFGFGIWQQQQQRVVGHNGSFPGVSSQLNMYLDSGYTVVVLSNHSFGADPIITKVDQLFGL